jgi:hypothetical protein
MGVFAKAEHSRHELLRRRISAGVYFAWMAFRPFGRAVGWEKQVVLAVVAFPRAAVCGQS